MILISCISQMVGSRQELAIEDKKTSTDLWIIIGNVWNLNGNDFYLLHNGRKVPENAVFTDGIVHVVPRLLGGKGGFGSMLRAIGAQIEKTTNREACRDLSGRRLRDINEEKREREAAERKRKKLERLRAEPKHKFEDETYEEERSSLTEKVSDAVEQG
ncbi:Protein SDE2 [Blattella germanica]|nr:Protein SDE2 [Blattella germanica]